MSHPAAGVHCRPTGQAGRADGHQGGVRCPSLVSCWTLCCAASYPKGLRGGLHRHADEVDCHEEHNDEEGNERPIWQAALRHTLEISCSSLRVSLVFGLIVEGVGEDVFRRPVGSYGLLPAGGGGPGGPDPQLRRQRVAHPLYVEGALRFFQPGCRSGTGAGVGLAVLWRANPSWKQNLFTHRPHLAAGAFVAWPCR